MKTILIVIAALISFSAFAAPAKLQCSQDRRSSDGALTVYTLERKQTGQFQVEQSKTWYSMQDSKMHTETKALADELDCIFDQEDARIFTCYFDKKTPTEMFFYRDVAKSTRMISMDSVTERRDDSIVIEGLTNLVSEKVERVAKMYFSSSECKLTN